MDALERLGQAPSDVDANAAMDAGFQLESEAIELGLRVIAATARALSTQAAELYLRHDAPVLSRALKPNVDLLSVLLLRVYLTGTDVDLNAPSAAQRATTAQLNAHERYMH